MHATLLPYEMASSNLLVALVPLALLLSATAAAQVEFDPKGWTRQAPVQLDGAPEGLVQVPLNEEIIDRALVSLADLRFVNNRGELVPHFVQTRGKRQPAAWHSVDLINRTYSEGDSASVTLDFGSRVRKNQVRVRLSGSNYRRYAVLQGRDGDEPWATVDTSWLVRVEDRGHTYAAETFRFPENDFRYLRLTAYNMEGEHGRIDVAGIERRHATVDPEPSVPVDIAVTPVEPTEEQGNVTIFEIDTGYRNLPLDELAISTDTYYFHRRFELLGRNAETETWSRNTEVGVEPAEREVPWTSIMRGVFYRMYRLEVKSEKLNSDFQGPYRYLQLIIHNEDDAPIDLAPDGIQLTRRPLHSVAFDPARGQSFDLYFGNPKAKFPKYDIARASGDVNRTDLPKVALGPPIATPDILDTLPFFEEFAWLVWVVLGLTVVVMIALILRNLRHVKPE